ncbi:hypothetical protein B0H13DRAFT_600854 [Mycena leptocephala]|nr:hypothetical protein B0H13DRAFT_600854 [Mycena leptocephala]
MGMSLTEASRLVRLGPRDPELRLEELYPDLTTVERRRDAWLEDNGDSMKEAMTLFISARPEMFPPGTTLDPTGSIFYCSGPGSYDLPIYWNPATISYEHEAFVYIVSAPHHVAALHAIPNKDAAFAYLFKHWDKRRPVQPMWMTVHTGWDPENEPAGPIPESAPLEGRVRYTLSDWRKRRAVRNISDRLTSQRYYLVHYDLKEVLGAEGQVVSSERGEEYVSELVSHL